MLKLQHTCMQIILVLFIILTATASPVIVLVFLVADCLVDIVVFQSGCVIVILGAH